MKSWRAVPLALRVAILTQVVNIALLLVLAYTHHDQPYAMKILLFSNGLSYVADAFALYGALELSRLLVGRAALGAKLAAFGWFASLVLSVVVVATRLGSDYEWQRSISPYFAWAGFTAKLCVAFGLALAAWNRPAVAAICVAAFLVAIRPPVIEHWLAKEVGNSFKYVRMVLVIGYEIVLLGVVTAAVTDLPADFVMREPERAKGGFDRMANSLWLRVCALVIVPLVTLLMVSGDGGGADQVLGYAGLFTAGINILSFTGFGAGALEVVRSRHPEVRSGAFLVAAAASLWCAGVAIHQIPDLWGSLPGHRDGEYLYFGVDTAARMFPYALPIIAAVAVIAAALAISGFAKRRENLELGGRAERTAILVGALQLLSIGMLAYLVPEARSTSSLLLLIVMALVFGLIAIINAARLARDTAQTANVAPGPVIPSATVL